MTRVGLYLESVAKEAALLPTLAELKVELAPLDLVVAADVERDVHEGTFHEGQSATVQIIGVKAGRRIRMFHERL